MDTNPPPKPFNYKDQVHGYITLPPYLKPFINVPEFQRLEDIKQLGTAFKVYRGAKHDRLSHCIGTSYLAHCFVKKIQLEYPELCVNDNDILCVTVAGLYHDIGHGPFSHLFEEFLREEGVQWDHEEVGCEIIRKRLSYLFLGHGGKDTMKSVTAMIRGDYNKEEAKKRPNKGFLYEIVHNRRTGIDVDKCDYYLRDSYNANVMISYNADRILKCFVIKDGMILYPEKEYHNIYEFFHTRNFLHATLYNHKAVWQVDEMVLQILRDGGEGIISIAKDNSYEKFLELGDDVIKKISSSTMNLLQNRILYKTLFEFHPKTDEEKNRALEVIYNEMKRCDLVSDNCQERDSESDYIVKWKKIGFEGKDHPLSGMEFVSKNNSSLKSASMLTSVLPRDHDVYIIRVMAKIPLPSDFEDVRTKLENLFKHGCSF